ncbi:ATP-binding protein [Streptomyces sp. NPDC006879]|uniref:ATP-binding protein n=1 Tax=Streptomyces sp. NPDC006879 TaxID=3364767 RepID=UPI0036A7F87C
MQRTPDVASSFVGRACELALLETAVAEQRLVTVVGSGGVGKSRLVRHLLSGRRVRGQRPAPGDRLDTSARPSLAAFQDGVHWADLSPLPDDRLLVASVADAVGLADHTSRKPLDALRSWLSDRRLLLVLDSCEHLIEPARELVVELLDTAPGVVVLATSRQPFALPAEHVIELGSLRYGADGPDEALALFAQRAAASVPEFDAPWPESWVGAARDICRRLQGVPLTLELAAAQLNRHSIEDLAMRLDRRIDPLTTTQPIQPARHRTLRTTIGWSHELCDPAERLLWARLSVFRGPFDEEAARSVCAGGPLSAQQVPHVLDALRVKSVLHSTPAGAAGSVPTLRMLDTVREYGAMWLGELKEHQGLRRRHAHHFQELVRRADAEWLGPAQGSWYRRIGAAHPDLCAALEFLLESAPARAQHMASRVAFFWSCCGHLHEARSFLQRALRLDGNPGPDRARALWALGVTLLLQGEHKQGHQLAVACGALARQGAGDPLMSLEAAYLLGISHLLAGRPLAARIVAENALQEWPGEPFGSAARLRCHLVLTFALTGMGLFAPARSNAEAIRAGCVARGEHWTRSYADYQLSLINLLEDRPHEAAAHARSMLHGKHQIGDSFGTALGLDLLAAANAAGGDGEAAARASGAGHAYWQAVGHPQRGMPELAGVREECERQARLALGDAGYERAFREGAGQRWSLAQGGE